MDQEEVDIYFDERCEGITFSEFCSFIESLPDNDPLKVMNKYHYIKDIVIPEGY